MSIEQANVIDYIGISKDHSCCVLIISDHLEWGDMQHLVALQDKINAYLAFVESGEIYEKRPNACDLKIEISVRSQYTPTDDDDIRFLQLARDAILDAGFMFSVIAEQKELYLPETKAHV